MSTILDLPEMWERVLRFSVEEYERMAELAVFTRRSELIRGVVLEKWSKSPLHRSLAKELYDRIKASLPAGFTVFQEAPLRLADSEPEPDIMIVAGHERDFRQKHPMTATLVIEVAVSSPALDRANAVLYAEAGVPEYWIVLGATRQIEVFRRLESGVYRAQTTVSFPGTLTCASVAGIEVSLSALFAA